MFYGADMDVINASGNTPLHICAVNNMVRFHYRSVLSGYSFQNIQKICFYYKTDLKLF